MPGKDSTGSQQHYQRRVAPLVEQFPWVLRVTAQRKYPVPLFVIKERHAPDPDDADERAVLVERGVLWGNVQRRLLPVVRAILGRVLEDADQPLELQQFLAGNRITFRGNLPVDEEAGAKLALIFKLRERLNDDDGAELIGRRVDRFTREEAAYWFSRITHFVADANRWAVAGMKVMLGGLPQDPGIPRMLDALRQSDANVPFAGLCALLRLLGFAERIRGDHHIFTRGDIEPILNLQPRGGQAKPYQVKQVRNLILQYNLKLDE